MLYWIRQEMRPLTVIEGIYSSTSITILPTAVPDSTAR